MQKTQSVPLRFAKIFPFLVLLAAGLAGGYLIGLSLSDITDQLARLPDTLSFLLVLLIVMVALYFQILLHEAGHLVFGLLTGYRFLSFRVGSLMIVREQGKLRLKLLSIAGTGGQCILLPPQWSESGAPYQLYHLGGAIANLLTGTLFLLAYLFLPMGAIAKALTAALAVGGWAIGLMNAIPLQTELVSNDGSNVLLLKKDPVARHASFRMLEIHGALAGGTRLKDMPEDWFTLPDGADRKNLMISSVEVFAINRLLDQQRFGETENRIRSLFSSGASVHGIHRNLLRLDLSYCCMLRADCAAAKQELDDPMRKFMLSMKRFPSVLRTRYAEAVLCDQSREQPEQLLALFDSVAKRYPFSADIESERELMQAARQTQHMTN